MKKALLALTIAFISITVFAQESQVSLVNENGDHFLPGTIVFKVKEEFRSNCNENAIEIPELKSALEALNFETVEKKFPRVQPPKREYNEHGQKLSDISLIYELAVPDNTDILAAAKKLSDNTFLEYAEPSYIYHDMAYVPNDAQLNSVMPYHFAKVMAYEAWDITKGDTNVIIGITDTSFDVDHEDLKDNIKYNYADTIGNGDDDNDSYIDNYAGWDMVDDDNTLFINNEIHGTAVAAIASASADNGIGYAGLGFNCKFIPVKVGDNSQSITKGYEGIQYCVEKGASVINCSWGNTSFSQMAQDVINWAAVNNDVVIVASAGNDDATAYFYPASYEHVLSVTGVDANDVFDDGSNPPPYTRNDSVDVSAPGLGIYTTATFNGNYLYSPPQGGTSMAAPIVSGIAALVRSEFPCLTADEVIEQIKATADVIDTISQNVPYAGMLGAGRVNAFNAVQGNLCTTVGMSENEVGVEEALIYPNPTSNQITLRLKLKKAANANIFIFDQLGREVIKPTAVRLKSGKNLQTFEVSDLPGGTYFVRVLGDEVILVRSFVVQK